MKQSIYVIYDAKAKIYNFPFQFLNDEVAHRACTDIISDPQSKIAQHPQDYYMFKLGDYEDETGQFDLLETKEEIAHFLHIKPAHALSHYPSNLEKDLGKLQLEIDTLHELLEQQS